jgi:hypothetical protein
MAQRGQRAESNTRWPKSRYNCVERRGLIGADGGVCSAVLLGRPPNGAADSATTAAAAAGPAAGLAPFTLLFDPPAGPVAAELEPLCRAPAPPEALPPLRPRPGGAGSGARPPQSVSSVPEATRWCAPPAPSLTCPALVEATAAGAPVPSLALAPSGRWAMITALWPASSTAAGEAPGAAVEVRTAAHPVSRSRGQGPPARSQALPLASVPQAQLAAPPLLPEETAAATTAAQGSASTEVVTAGAASLRIEPCTQLPLARCSFGVAYAPGRPAGFPTCECRSSESAPAL